MATTTQTLNNRQDSRWTQADGKECKEANTIGHKHYGSACQAVVSEHQELNHSHAAGGWFYLGTGGGGFCMLGFFFFNICIMAIEGIKATGRRIKR